MIKIKNNKLFLAVSFLLAVIFTSNVFSYAPRVDLQYKGGNKRHIGRYGFLIPLYGQTTDLFFTNMFFMHDSKSSLEGNFGLGYRRKINDQHIIGTYGFWDIRKIKNVSKKINQATFGIEYMTGKFESRFNVYFPQNKRFFLKNLGITSFSRNFDASTGTVQSIGRSTNYVVPLPGLDIEVGGNILKQLELFGAFYHFNGRKGAKAINGFRFRTAFYIYHWLDIEAEMNHDNVRKWSNYAGIRFTYSFEKNRPIKNSVNDKMTQLAVRDVDVVSNEAIIEDVTDDTIDNDYSALLLSPDDLKQLQGAKLSGNALFTDSDKLEQEKAKRPDIVNKLVVLGTIDRSGGVATFKPLIVKVASGDDEVDPEVTKKLSTILKNKSQADSLFSTSIVKDALSKTTAAGKLDQQSSNFIGAIGAEEVWQREINKLLTADTGGRAVSSDLIGKTTKVYGCDTYAVPLIMTDIEGNRSVAISNPGIIMKLPKSAIDKMPAAIKNKLINAGINLDTELDIFYITQNIVFGDNGDFVSPVPNGTPAALRIHPYVHNDAPQNGAGQYRRTNYFDTFVIKPGDANLTPISENNGNKRDVFTHNGNAGTPMQWSPPNMYIPLTVYRPANLTPFTAQQPETMITLSIRDPNNAATGNRAPLGKKSVVVWHDIISSDNNDRIQRMFQKPVYQSGPKRLVDVLNDINNPTFSSVDNAQGDITRLKNTAGMILGMEFKNNQFVYKPPQ
ncbi:MAG: inverse autotransporter beta domain-containing protein [Legionellales bacterium]|nr:inverse autotransporter beta domain-containing protein [Legionellales bacterium]